MKFVGERLEALRAALVLNWGELAAHLGISRAMLDFLRAGARRPSPKTLRLIAAAERAAGIAPAPAVPGVGKKKGGRVQVLEPPGAGPPRVLDSERLAQIEAACNQVKSELAEMKTMLHDLLAGGGVAALKAAHERGAKAAG